MPVLSSKLPCTRLCISRTRLASLSIASVEPKDVIVSQRVVRSKRPSGSVSYAECSATPVNAAGCAACISSARIPPTRVAIQPCTSQTALSGPNNPTSFPIAICCAHSGAPVESPETVFRKASAALLPPRAPSNLFTA